MAKHRALDPWFMRLPSGLRDRPAWVFIGFLVGLVGASYMFGFSESRIVEAVGATGIQVWGALLMLAGLGVSITTITARHALERLSLRVLSVCILMYCGWILTIVDLNRAAMTIALGLGLVISAQIRAMSLGMLFKAAPDKGADTDARE